MKPNHLDKHEFPRINILTRGLCLTHFLSHQSLFATSFRPWALTVKATRWWADSYHQVLSIGAWRKKKSLIELFSFCYSKSKGPKWVALKRKKKKKKGGSDQNASPPSSLYADADTFSQSLCITNQLTSGFLYSWHCNDTLKHVGMWTLTLPSQL